MDKYLSSYTGPQVDDAVRKARQLPVSSSLNQSIVKLDSFVANFLNDDTHANNIVGVSSTGENLVSYSLGDNLTLDSSTGTISAQDTDTWRPVKVNGSLIIDNTKLNLVAGDNVNLAASVMGKDTIVTISSTGGGGGGTSYTASNGVTLNNHDFQITGASSADTNTFLKKTQNGFDWVASSTFDTWRPICIGSTWISSSRPLALYSGTGINFNLDTSGSQSDPIEVTINGFTLSNETAAEGGTALSAVTTGEKYNWNNKSETTVEANTVSASDFPDRLTSISINNSKYIIDSSPLLLKIYSDDSYTTAVAENQIQDDTSYYYKLSDLSLVYQKSGIPIKITNNGYSLQKYLSQGTQYSKYRQYVDNHIYEWKFTSSGVVTRSDAASWKNIDEVNYEFNSVEITFAAGQNSAAFSSTAEGYLNDVLICQNGSFDPSKVVIHYGDILRINVNQGYKLVITQGDRETTYTDFSSPQYLVQPTDSTGISLQCIADPTITSSFTVDIQYVVDQLNNLLVSNSMFSLEKDKGYNLFVRKCSLNSIFHIRGFTAFGTSVLLNDTYDSAPFTSYRNISAIGIPGSSYNTWKIKLVKGVIVTRDGIYLGETYSTDYAGVITTQNQPEIPNNTAYTFVEGRLLSDCVIDIIGP